MPPRTCGVLDYPWNVGFRLAAVEPNGEAGNE
jgi:hypothetical protein